MSRTLRRPMFRGGRVSSYGTGIASGLAEGGRVGYYIDRKGGIVTGGDIMNMNRNQALKLAELYGPTSIERFPGETEAYQTVTGPIMGGETGGSDWLKNWYNRQKPEYKTFESYVTETGDVPIDTETGKEREVVPPGEKGDTVTGQGFVTPKANIDTRLIDKKVLEIQNSDDAELSLEDIKEALGGKKAFGRDATDMLLGFAGAKGDTVMEKFQDFAATESKKGPSRTEQIDTAAATFMLKDKFQSKRDKANIEMLKTKIDYSIAAGKNISIAEGVLAATKGTNFSDKKLAAAIQGSNSEATGEKYKFKGVTDIDGLKAGMKSGELTVGDTIIVKETVKIEGQPDKILKKIIEIQLIDGKLQLKEIYRV